MIPEFWRDHDRRGGDCRHTCANNITSESSRKLTNVKFKAGSVSVLLLEGWIFHAGGQAGPTCVLASSVAAANNDSTVGTRSRTDSPNQTGVRVTGSSQRFLSEAARNLPGNRRVELPGGKNHVSVLKKSKNSTAAGNVFSSIQTKL